MASGRRIDMPILEFGFHARQTEPFLRVMGRERLLLLRSADLRADPQLASHASRLWPA